MTAAPPQEFSDRDSLRGDGKRKKGSPKGKADEALRSMPVNSDAERAVLSCLLQDPVNMIPRAIETMQPDFFYIPSHKTLYTVLLDLYKNRKGGALDLVVVNTELADKELLDAVGGAKSVAELLNEVPTTALFDDYMEFLKEKFILRRVISDCTHCVSGAYENAEPPAVFLDSVEKKILSIRNETERENNIDDMRSCVSRVLDQIDQAYNGKGAAGLKTGFHDLDDMTNGFFGGEMIIVAARPSMGKTSFVMNIVENISVRKDNPIPVAVFSLEMSSESLVQRVLCSRAKVKMSAIRGGMLSKSDFPKLMVEAQALANAPIFIDDTPGLSIGELQAKARRLKKESDIQLIAIDYLQLLKAPDVARRDGREKEVAEISGGLKSIAKELNIPIIVLAQLNRNPDSRGGKPRMSDLRESGSIEQDADLVGLLMRSEVYADDEDDREEKSGEAEFIIAKQRNGPTGEVPLVFHKEYMRFDNRAKGEEP